MTIGLLDPQNDALVDMVQPVNLLHPLNRGLVGWWIALPGTMGSSRFMDIVSPGPNGNHGTLTNMNPATDWVGGPPGLWSALDFEGGDDHVLLGDVPATGDRTFAFSAMKRDWGASNVLLYFVNSGSENVDYFSVGGLAGNTNLLASGGNTPDASKESSSLVDNRRYHFVVTKSTAQVEDIYVDGIQDTQSGTNQWGGNTARAAIGASLIFGVPAVPWDGQCSSVQVYNRILTANEAAFLSRLSRQGYPGMLNRLP